MWWRLGNAYYSCLRELYVLAVLREAGVPAEYHVIADALFRADFRAGETIISLYVRGTDGPLATNTATRSSPRSRRPRRPEHSPEHSCIH